MKLHYRFAFGTADTILLLRNLGVMLKAGVPLNRALTIVEQDAPRHTRSLISHLRRCVEAGHPLADAMQTAPRSFPALTVNLVRTGELSGTLQESLATIVKHLQKSQDLRRKIVGALMYPSFVMIAIFGLGMSIATLVLPQLIPLFESLDVDLPLPTKILLFVARIFDAHGFVIVALVFLSIIGLLVISRFDAMKPIFHRFYLRIPFAGAVLRHATIAQIASTLGTLLQSGIAIREAMDATAMATRNRVFRQALLRAIAHIESGHTLSEGLRKSMGLFPGMSLTLISIGEESGSLATTLQYLAESYEAEVDYDVKNMTTALEPILLIVIGIIVGFTVLSIITPIYDITGSIK